jgi:hypothetical protein
VQDPVRTPLPICTPVANRSRISHHQLDTLSLNNNVPRSPPTFSSLTPTPGANGQFLSTSPLAGTALPPSLAQPIQIPHATGPASLGHRGSVGSLGEEIGGVGSSWKPASPSPTASPSLGAKKESPYSECYVPSGFSRVQLWIPGYQSTEGYVYRILTFPVSSSYIAQRVILTSKC